MNVQVVSLFIARVLTCRVSPSPPSALWACKDAGMLVCPAPGQTGTGMKKMPVPEPDWYRKEKNTYARTEMLQYRSEMPDAGMPMLS